MKTEEMKTRYLQLFDRCFNLHIIEGATREIREEIDITLGGLKHWMEVHNHPGTSEDLKELAQDIFEEYADDLEKLLKKK